MPGSTTIAIYGPVEVTIRDRKNRASLTMTVYSKGNVLQDIATVVERALKQAYQTTSISDRRHKRR